MVCNKYLWIGSVFSFFFLNSYADIPREKKLWTFLVYMSADNDLHLFADRNIEQMKRRGSNELVNILVHLDIHKPNTPKVTKRLVIHKNRADQFGEDMCMDSGSEMTLLNALEWADSYFPAEHFCIVFWNHGSGDLNPIIGKSINPSQLFYYNPYTKLIELDRSIGFLEYLDALIKNDSDQRGVCFDETMGSYLDDQKIKWTLNTFCSKRGKKIDIALFDACLMAGIGTAWLIHPYVDFMVASEEVALGPGYDYSLLLSGLTLRPCDPASFAKHVVQSYQQTYSPITQDYTQSALQLSMLSPLVQNVDMLGKLLMQALELQRNNSVKNIIRQSMLCVVFDEPSYRDIGSFYAKLLPLVKNFQLSDKKKGAALIKQIEQTITGGLQCISTLVIANATGRRVKEACGVYIYLPSKRIHPSYKSTEFGQATSWLRFLEAFLAH